MVMTKGRTLRCLPFVVPAVISRYKSHDMRDQMCYTIIEFDQRGRLMGIYLNPGHATPHGICLMSILL